MPRREHKIQRVILSFTMILTSWFGVPVCSEGAHHDKNRNNGTSPHVTRSTNAGQYTRTIRFANESIGGLYVLPYTAGYPVSKDNHQEVAVAKGSVTVKVPPGFALLLACNARIFDHPELLAEIPPDAIECIEIKAAPIDDSDLDVANKAMTYLNHLTGLKQLYIPNLGINDADLSKIKTLKKLDLVLCTIGDVNGACFKDFQGMTELANVEFSYNPIKGENFQYLARCPKLRRLIVRGCHVDETGVKGIAETTVSDLSLTNNKKVDDACMKHVAKMKNMEILSLDQTSVKTAGITELKNLKHLRRLNLSDSYEFRHDLPELKRMLPSAHIELINSVVPVDKDLRRMLAPLK